MLLPDEAGFLLGKPTIRLDFPAIFVNNEGVF